MPITMVMSTNKKKRAAKQDHDEDDDENGNGNECQQEKKVRRTELGSRQDGTRMTMAMSIGRKKMARITQPRLGQL